ncbi:MAG: 3-deoxy-manno-octulosonate cytidylyltransferase [Bacteroidota bacterium]
MSSDYIVGIIPARYASTRLPAKALVDICGKPMVQRVYEQAKKSRLLSRVIVATDDERIEEVVRQFGGDVMMTPATCTSGSDRCAVAAQAIDADLIVNIQGDEPLIPPSMIDEAIQPLIDNQTIPMGTIVRPITLPEELCDPAVVKVVMDRNGFALYFSRSVIPFVRDVPEKAQWTDHCRFYKHFGLYIFRKEFLLHYSALPETELEKAESLEQLRVLENGYKIRVVVTLDDSIAVDTADDLLRVVDIIKGQV